MQLRNYKTEIKNKLLLKYSIDNQYVEGSKKDVIKQLDGPNLKIVLRRFI